MRTYTLESNNKVYVGQNARDNEEMVLFVNEVDALWFHIEDESGPHVIVESASATDIKEAARYARGNHTGRCTVMYCNIRELSKNHKCAVGEFITPENYNTVTLKK